MNRMVVDSRPFPKKRTLHFHGSVSRQLNRFSCEGESFVKIKGKGGLPWSSKVSVGISKKEELISDYYGMNSLRSVISV